MNKLKNYTKLFLLILLLLVSACAASSDQQNIDMAKQSLAYIQEYHKSNNVFPSYDNFYKEFYLKKYPNEKSKDLHYTVDYRTNCNILDNCQVAWFSYGVKGYSDKAIGKKCGSDSGFGFQYKYCINPEYLGVTR